MYSVNGWIACEQVLTPELHGSPLVIHKPGVCMRRRGGLGPRLAVAQEEVGEYDQLAHDGEDRNFAALASGLEPQKDALLGTAARCRPHPG